MENNPSPRHTAKEPCDTPPGERRRGLGVFVIWPLAALAAVMCGLIVFRHRTNIRRLIAGTENKIGQKKADTGNR